MAGQYVGRGPKKSVDDDDFLKRRRPQESGGATARSVSPRVAGSNTRCLTPRDAGEPEEDARTPDGSGAAADGSPTPVEASRRKEIGRGPGGSVVEGTKDDGGEGSGGRAGAEVRERARIHLEVLWIPRHRDRVGLTAISRLPRRRAELDHRARGRLSRMRRARNAHGECTRMGRSHIVL